MTNLNSQNKKRSLNGTSQLQKLVPSPFFEPIPDSKATEPASQFGLRKKIIAIAISFGFVPTLIIGSVAYKVAEINIVRQANQKQFERTQHLAQLLEEYINNRVNEAQVIANSPIFNNPNLMDVATVKQKKAALNNFQAQTGFYDNIAYLDLKGNPLFQSQSERPIRKNYGDRAYFRKAITTKAPVMNEVGISRITGKSRIEFALPVTNAWTDELLGVLRFRIPSEQIKPLLTSYVDKNEQWYIINTENIFTSSSLNNLNNHPLTNHYPQLQTAHVGKETRTSIGHNPQDPNREQIVSYAPVKLGPLNPNLNLGTAIAINTDIAYAPLQSLRLIFIVGTISTGILAAFIASFLANRLLQVISKLTSTINRLSQGQLDARTRIRRKDELGSLGKHIDYMADQLESSFNRQKNITQASQVMLQISQAMSNRELQLPLSTFLQEVRSFVKADRVLFYQFDEQWGGMVVAESVNSNLPRTLGVEFDDPCFAREYVGKYRHGRIQVLTDIYQANLTKCYLHQLELYKVRACVVLPVILNGATENESERLIGLLIAHQCKQARVWSQSDVDYLQQVAYQLAQILRGFVNHHKINIQQAIVNQDVAHLTEASLEMARGNFDISLSEKIASSSHITSAFDRIISNMGQSIAQIKIPTQQINGELSSSKKDMIDFKEQLRKQANELSLIFTFLEQAVTSVTEIAEKINQASETVGLMVTDIQMEKAKFNEAISFKSKLEDTLKNNNHKIKELSNASQKMSRVIAVIRKINLRASILASKLNQRIPEIDKSEYGLKEEIESIQQSIAATKELENVIQGIDREIAMVLRDYDRSEKQLQQENDSVIQASSNLARIAEACKNVQQNLLSLVNMTKVQVQSTQKINEFKNRLDKTTEQIEETGDRASESLEKASLTAKDLENVTNFFKLKQQTEQN